jgi:hypothetical protein
MKYSYMYVYTRMIFAAVSSPAIKIFHRHLGPNLKIFIFIIFTCMNAVLLDKGFGQAQRLYTMYTLPKMIDFWFDFWCFNATFNSISATARTPRFSKKRFFCLNLAFGQVCEKNEGKDSPD